MPRKPQADARTVALLEEVLESARAGEVVEVFIVHKFNDGSFNSCFRVTDLEDMAYQVRTELIRAQTFRPDPTKH